MTYVTSQGRPTDVEAILVWTAIFIAVAWILFVLPLIFLVPDASRIFSPPVAPVFGAVYGLVAFLLLVGWWTGLWIERLYLNYSLVVGSTTGLAYSSFLYLLRRTEAVKSEGAA